MMPGIKKFFKEFGTIILCIAILVYIAIHLAMNFSSGIETEISYYVSLDDSVVLDGYIMRDEELVILNERGTIVPSVSEGERVSVGNPLFSIYSGEGDAGIENEIAEIDAKIETLVKSGSEAGAFVTDIARVDEKIDAGLSDVLMYASQNSFRSASGITNDILVNMNRRWLMTEGETAFDGKIAELEARKEELKATLSGEAERYYSKSTGYFSGSVDGYESIFDPELLDTMSTSDFFEMTEKPADASSISKASGKIIKSFKWRVLCHRTKHEANEFTVGASYPVVFPYSYNTEISMVLERIISEAAGEDAILVFATSYMPGDFNYERKQEVEIVKKRYTGLQIPKSALRMIEGDIRTPAQKEAHDEQIADGIDLTEELKEKIAGPHKGVYILDGNIIRFKYCEPLCAVGDYYIIDATNGSYLERDGKTEKYTKYERLELYDRVIIGGKNLKTGDIVE